MKGFTSTFALAGALSSFLLPSALAHGFVKLVTVEGDDTQYTGVMTGGGGTSNSGVVRKINSANPNHIKDASALPCGPGAAKRYATSSVKATAGSTLSFIWDGGDGHSEWPHEWGPILNYIAECKEAGCKDDASTLSFYKVDQVGLKPKSEQKSDSNGGKWWLGDISGKKNKGKPLTLTLPKTLADGDYLVRHEIIALHEAENPKMGPEYYPSCIHVTISGSSAKTNNVKGDAVTFPSAYTTSDFAGNKHLTDSIFHPWTKQDYIFPGPPVATFGVASADGGSGDGGDSGASGNDTGSGDDAGSGDATSAGNDDGSSSTGNDDGSTSTGNDSTSGKTCAADNGDDENTGDDGTDDGTDDGGDDAASGVQTVTVTVTKTVTASSSSSTSNKRKRSRHAVNRLPSGH